MRIVVWGINYAPEETGIAPFNTGLCRYLKARGHDVRMVTTFAYYPAWQKLPTDRGRLYRTDLIDGVTVHRCWHYVPAHITAKRRMLHELTFALTSFFRALFLPRADIYVVVSPPLILGPCAWLLTRLRRSRYVFHVQDLQPDAALGLHMLKPGLFTRLLYLIERWSYAGAAAVSGITHGMLEAYRRKGVPAEKRLYFPNWIGQPTVGPLAERAPAAGEKPKGQPGALSGKPGVFENPAPSPQLIANSSPLPASISPLPAPRSPLPAPSSKLLAPSSSLSASAFRLRHDIPADAFLAVYSGNIGRKQGIEVLIDAAALLKNDSRIVIVIAGSGAGRALMEKRCADHRLPNVRLLPLLPTDEYQAMLAAADIAPITQAPGTGQFFFPSKLLSVLSAGLPVITVADDTSELARAVADGGFGVNVPTGQPSTLAEALRSLAQDRSRLRAYAEATTWVHRFAADRVLGDFEEKLAEIVRR